VSLVEVVSVVSVFVAAVAAVFACATVVLTISYAQERRLRTLADSLILIQSTAANVREVLASGSGVPPPLDALGEALVALQRATALRPPPIPESISDRRDRLFEQDKARPNVLQAEEDAAEAYNNLRVWQPPRGWRLLIATARARF